MIDPETPAPELSVRKEATAGRLGARERHEARSAAVALVAPEIETFLRSTSPAADAVRVLYQTWQIDHAAATVWREMYHALQATLAEAAAAIGVDGQHAADFAERVA